MILASVYNTLERLEQKGLVRSTVGQPTPERGGRAKRYFSMTASGMREVKAAKKALTPLARHTRSRGMNMANPRFVLWLLARADAGRGGHREALVGDLLEEIAHVGLGTGCACR